MKNLVFQGGGVHGYAHVGGLKALEMANMMNLFENFAGASVGALVAFAAACRIGATDIYNKVEQIDESLLTGGRNIFSAFYYLIKRGGMYNTGTFRRWLEDVTEEWLGTKSITFDQLNARFGTDLFVTVTSAGLSKPLIMSRETYPTINILDTLEMTIAIPFYYEPIRFNGDLIVDGGYINNLPLHIFDTEENGYFNRESVGFSVLTDKELEPLTKPMRIDGFFPLVKRLISILLTYASYYREDERDAERIIPICVGPVDSFDFTIPKRTKQILYKIGQECVEKWLRKNTQTDFVTV